MLKVILYTERLKCSPLEKIFISDLNSFRNEFSHSTLTTRRSAELRILQYNCSRPWANILLFCWIEWLTVLLLTNRSRNFILNLRIVQFCVMSLIWHSLRAFESEKISRNFSWIHFYLRIKLNNVCYMLVHHAETLLENIEGKLRLS